MYHLFAFCLNIFAFFLPLINCSEKDCINLDVTITQKIENLGFHRDLNWLVETQNLDPKTSACSVALKLNIGQGMFVNPDQVDDLRRLKKLDAIIDGIVDIEAPAHEATKHTVYIFLNGTQLLDKIALKLPIHLRYQRSLIGGHGKVILNKPWLLVRCPNSIICGKDRKVSAPISSKEAESFVVWKNISYKAQFDEMELLVPVGNLNDYAYVAIITCILGCAGCVYILSLTTAEDNEDNKK
ncbi:unnamed protein product [Ceutorhynchus assimilis]|uniref:Phosphatidylinositol-glycan biosynthesis class X protein n=1 Tax=Ceutorhynchus assimilis TaxID=467358 RepID=A0A9N9N092_9CUCU|nr:unnamed protein product [Ceutorhynchus assimilis]